MSMHRFIDPITLARVKDLPLVAKTVAQGFLHGMHDSTQKGTGVEFSQFRAYEPGDPPARIDWKLFARSDKYFVREAERESDTNVWLLLDASQSMLYASQHTEKATSLTKFEYGRYLLATFAYLAQHQGDAVGLFGLSSNQLDFLPALSGQRHLQKLMLQLARMQSGGVFPQVQTVQAQISKVRSHGLVIVVSDFYQNNGEIIELISQLVNHKTDVIAVQLESNDEIEFSYKGQIQFEDLETHARVLVSAKDAKDRYLEARSQFNQRLSDDLDQLKISLVRANIDQPLDQTVFDFLTARQRVRRVY